MNPDSPQPDAADLIELGAVALQGLLRPLALDSDASIASSPGRTRPVVFVHGWGGSRAGWYPLIAYLSLLGFDRLFACDPDAQTPFPDQARRLAHTVETLAAACRIGRGSVDLVAHGTGGLAARLYAQEHGGAKRVDRLITLATPHRGTVSPFWAATPLGPDLLPDSSFMARLNEEARQSPIRHLSIWTDRDALIAPAQHAICERGEELHIDGSGHHALLFHPQVMQQIAGRLAEGQRMPRGSLRNAGRWAGRRIRRLIARHWRAKPAQKVPSR